jgi:hypothetical protein
MHRPIEDGEPLPAIAISSRVEFVGGPRAGQQEDRSDLPETIALGEGTYRRSVRCAEDGAMRYVWQTSGEEGRTPDHMEA